MVALRRPEQVQALIVQNGNAYEEGLREFWDPIKKYWADPRPENRAALHVLVEPKSTRWQYENGVTDRTLLDPTTWILDQVGLDREGNREIQMDLFYDYRTNVPLYPRVPGLLPEVSAADVDRVGQERFHLPARRGAPSTAAICRMSRRILLDTGHFALETHGDEIASRIEGFLGKSKEIGDLARAR